MKAATKFLLKNLSCERLTRVVDVGANPLSPPEYTDLLRLKGCELWGFEPQKEAYEQLLETKSDLETYFPYAVGDGTTKKLNIYKSSGLTSLFKPYEGAFRFLGRSRRNMELIESASMKTIRMDDISEIEQFDVLKIDIQGGEVMVFKGAKNKLRDAVVVIPEVRFYQLYEKEPMFGGVDVELRKQGFQLHKFDFLKPKVAPNSQIDRLKRTHHRNQVIDGDAIYIRDLGKDNLLSDEQLKHISIAATSIFKSVDVALFCLDRLVERGAIHKKIPAQYVDKLDGRLKK